MSTYTRPQLYHYPHVSGKFFDMLRRLVTKNPSFARSNIDLIAFTIFMIGGHMALWFELYQVLPYYHPRLTVTPVIVCHYVVAVFVYINAFSNLYYVINTPASGSYLDICASQQASWHYCPQCESHVPPRCHHCIVCAVCVLKRDHHCWFAGCCIGHQNYRYYFSMVFAVWLGAFYSNLFHYQYIADHLYGYSLTTLFSVILPHCSGMIGYLSLYQFFVALMAFVALLCFFLFTWLLGIQLMQLYSGQTEYERSQGQFDYDLGPHQNLLASLGHQWFLILLAPWIPSSLSCDGMNFKTAAKDE